MRQYSIIRRAIQLRCVDEDYQISKQAFLNEKVQAVDKKGNYAYPTLESLFDYEKEIANILNPQEVKEKQRNNPALEMTRRFNKIIEQKG